MTRRLHREKSLVNCSKLFSRRLFPREATLLRVQAAGQRLRSVSVAVAEPTRWRHMCGARSFCRGPYGVTFTPTYRFLSGGHSPRVEVAARVALAACGTRGLCLCRPKLPDYGRAFAEKKHWVGMCANDIAFFSPACRRCCSCLRCTVGMTYE